MSNLISTETFRTAWDLFMAFLRPGIFGFGGGPSSIPLIQREVVDQYGWMNIEEFTDALAFGNMLPGPIATKMSALIGYRVMGWGGAAIALIATVLPTALAIILLLKIYLRYRDAAWMDGMMTAVRPVVVILVAQVVFLMGRKSFPNVHTYVIAAITILALGVLNLHPALLIVAALAYGGFFLG